MTHTATGPNVFTDEELQANIAVLIQRAVSEYGPRTDSRPVVFAGYRNRHPIMIPCDDRLEIWLDEQCRVDRFRAHYELAHEVVHTLSREPGGDQSTFLEEGAAEAFAQRYVVDAFGPISGEIDHPAYAAALSQVKALNALCGIDAIRRFREVEPCLSRATAGQFAEVFPKVPQKLVESLVTLFPKRTFSPEEKEEFGARIAEIEMGLADIGQEFEAVTKEAGGVVTNGRVDEILKRMATLKDALEKMQAIVRERS